MIRTYMASSIWLTYCAPEFVAANGGRQFSIVCKTTSKKRLAKILNISLCSLNFAGCHLASDGRAAVAVKPETVYYEAPNYSGKWHEYRFPIQSTHPMFNSAKLIVSNHCGLFPCCRELDGSYSPLPGWTIVGWCHPPYPGSKKYAIVFEKTTPKNFDRGDYNGPGMYWAHGDATKFIVYKS